MESARVAARGKRKRPDVARFLHEMEPNLCGLQRELEEGTYRPGAYRMFWIPSRTLKLTFSQPIRIRLNGLGALQPLARDEDAQFGLKMFSRSKLECRGESQLNMTSAFVSPLVGGFRALT
jgi:hypothetical protein